ncbi:MAG: hypothetical protein ABJF10_03095 [Chthoniobacter sp.]|uniref:hypothetical protein n=1 Tax=Chthoniobacter sp. TaxID=2510640 RepID=UPI0032A5FB20
MKHPLLPVLALAALVSLGACERKVAVVETVPATPIPEPVAQTKTLETTRLGAAVDDYQREPTAAHKAEVNKTLARLDEEIAELQEYVAKHDGDARAKAAAKLENMQSYRAAEALRFTAAQAGTPIEAARPADDRTGADKARDAAQKVGESVQEGARKAGDAIKDAVHPN